MGDGATDPLFNDLIEDIVRSGNLDTDVSNAAEVRQLFRRLTQSFRRFPYFLQVYGFRTILTGGHREKTKIAKQTFGL